jgi:hypothetical protein
MLGCEGQSPFSKEKLSKFSKIKISSVEKFLNKLCYVGILQYINIEDCIHFKVCDHILNWYNDDE